MIIDIIQEVKTDGKKMKTLLPSASSVPSRLYLRFIRRDPHGAGIGRNLKVSGMTLQGVWNDTRIF